MKKVEEFNHTPDQQLMVESIALGLSPSIAQMGKDIIMKGYPTSVVAAALYILYDKARQPMPKEVSDGV